VSRIQIVMLVVWFAWGFALLTGWSYQQLAEIGQPRVAYAR